MSEERINVANGKYTVILCDDGSSRVLRYGRPWPAFESGKAALDNLHHALVWELIEARRALGPVP